MVDSAAVAGWAPKAPSNKRRATTRDFLRLRMDFFLQAAVSSIAVGASDAAPEGLVARLGGAFVSCPSKCMFFRATATEITLLSPIEDHRENCDFCPFSPDSPRSNALGRIALLPNSLHKLTGKLFYITRNSPALTGNFQSARTGKSGLISCCQANAISRCLAALRISRWLQPVTSYGRVKCRDTDVPTDPAKAGSAACTSRRSLLAQQGRRR